MAGYSTAAEGSSWDPRERLAWRNRRLLAERLSWPAGAVETCEQLEVTHSGWSFSWRAANTVPGFERPEGFYATTTRGWRDITRHGATPEELAEALKTTPNPNNRKERPVLTDLSTANWFKSKRSGAAGHCVETAFLEFGPVAVRDSKDKTGPALVFAPGAWDSFVDGVKAGDFAQP